jgi:Arc/MetJ-type ribon-helix-helix transcriptional regulator
MRSSKKNVIRKKRGRPATGQDPVSAIRLPVELTAAIDKWAARNDAPSRSDAIRRLVELGLAKSQPMKKRSPKAASKALELAARQVDKLADSSIPPEERQRRKRRLLKGPGEFRELRADLPKKKV